MNNIYFNFIFFVLKREKGLKDIFIHSIRNSLAQFLFFVVKREKEERKDFLHLRFRKLEIKDFFAF